MPFLIYFHVKKFTLLEAVCVCVCVCVCVSKKPWREHERLTFNFRGGGSAARGGCGGHEGGQDDDESVSLRHRPLS